MAGGTAHAQAPASSAGPVAVAGNDALVNARNAWTRGQFDAAELFYKSALDHGGLAPQDTLEAYVHLGAARAVLGKKDLARAAFRQAALIDWRFKVPAEAGKKAAQMAAAARKDEAKLRSIVLRATFPQTVSAGEPFGVDASLDPKHAGVTAKVGIDARDPMSGKHWATSDVAATKVHFEVPADVALAGETLVVRVDALDAHDNRLATREQRVQVEGVAAPPVVAPPPRPAVVAPPPPPAAPKASLALVAYNEKDRDRDRESKGGFWSSPWPYVIGGAVLAAGGAVLYYETRPTDNVSLDPARVTTR